MTITRFSPIERKVELAEELLAACGSIRITLLDGETGQPLRCQDPSHRVCRNAHHYSQHKTNRQTIQYLRGQLSRHPHALLGIVPTSRVTILAIAADIAEQFISRWELADTFITRTDDTFHVYLRTPRVRTAGRQWTVGSFRQRKFRYLAAVTSGSVAAQEVVLAPGQVAAYGLRSDVVSGELSQLSTGEDMARCWVFRNDRRHDDVEVAPAAPEPAVKWTVEGRRFAILRLVERAGASARMGTHGLAELLGVSVATVSRDLQWLVKEGMLVKLETARWTTAGTNNKVAVYARRTFEVVAMVAAALMKAVKPSPTDAQEAQVDNAGEVKGASVVDVLAPPVQPHDAKVNRRVPRAAVKVGAPDELL